MIQMRFLTFNTLGFLFVAGIISLWPVWSDVLFAEDTKGMESKIEIIIKETNLVTPSHVYLGDISDIHANGFLKETLEKIDLGKSPKPDKIKFITRKKIASIIRGQRYLPQHIIITSPERVYVKRRCQRILKKDVRKFVDQSLSQVFKNKEYHLTALGVRGLEPYPQGNITFLPDSYDMVDKNGRLSFFLDILINGKKEDRVSVSGDVAVFEPILHAKRSVSRGEVISRADVYLEKKNIFQTKGNVIKTFDEIAGKILKSDVRKGDYLKADGLAEPPLIRKGDIVTLIARNETLLIVTTGVSKEDGFENEVIKVENLDSGKLVRGIVKEKSKVEVVY